MLDTQHFECSGTVETLHIRTISFTFVLLPFVVDHAKLDKKISQWEKNNMFYI